MSPFTWMTNMLADAASLNRGIKRAIVVIMDLILCIQSIWIAYSLRVGAWMLWNDAIRIFALGAIISMFSVFLFMGLYKAIFRYVGPGMLRTLSIAFILYSIPITIIFTLYGVVGVPRTMGIIQPTVLFILIAISRLTIRYLIADLLPQVRFGGEKKRVLIYGAGDAGQQLAVSMSSEPSIELLGYIDDDRRLKGQKLDGTKIYWSDQLGTVIEKYRITDIMLALPNISLKKRRAIVESLQDYKVHVQTLPNMRELIDGDVSFNDIRDLDIEDLLGREPVKPNELLLGRTIIGKTVMVTGAGGSIGGELCRQILDIGTRRLVLLELSEYSLYQIERELKELLAERRTQDEGGDVEIISILGSVTDRMRLAEIFEQYDINTVYHAAAYKHVPLVEQNPSEALRNNIVGTFELANASYGASVDDFILISTDKAVRPTNIMGASKRSAEQVVQSFASRSKSTRFSMVRFGNVLGSSGSVVPLFRRQIKEGGPITLTHREVTRYFMTIPEAALLVIQASGMAKGGEVFVLDMGKSVRIYDLARMIVQLSGLSLQDDSNPDGDIAIKEVGLRPGEKLYEELLIGEKPQETIHPRIMMAHEGHLQWSKISGLLGRIDDCRKLESCLELLREFVPEFEHQRDNIGGDTPGKTGTQ